MSVSIVIPCYNEEEIIEKVVRSYYQKVISRIADSECIVIDDCSSDKTYEILQGLKGELPRLDTLRMPRNSGHGKALRLGYEHAQKDFIFQVDSDNQFEPDEFWKLYTLKDSYDFILGFRKIRYDPLPRLILTKTVRLGIYLIFGIWIKDANCPFRLIRKKTLKELLELISPDALAPNIMISILAKFKKTKMTEVIVTHYPRKTGKAWLGKLKLIVFSLKGFIQLIALRKRLAICGN
jgi:glycosyltransferase involved in cell wall biosynthesis